MKKHPTSPTDELHFNGMFLVQGLLLAPFNDYLKQDTAVHFLRMKGSWEKLTDASFKPTKSL